MCVDIIFNISGKSVWELENKENKGSLPFVWYLQVAPLLDKADIFNFFLDEKAAVIHLH